MALHKDFMRSTNTLDQANPTISSFGENKTEGLTSSDNNSHQVPEKVKTVLLFPNGKLLSDKEIETFSQRNPEAKPGDYCHRKKAGLMTSDRIDSDYPIAIGKDGAFYAVYRDPQFDEPVLLGKGTYGKVKLAQDQRFSSTAWVATKIIKTEADDEKSEQKCRQDVTNELTVTQEMGQASSNVIFERRGKDGLLKFQFFMDLAKGETLHLLVKEQTLPEDPINLLKIGLNFLRELGRLHQLDYVHRDIKTGNMFVDIRTGKVTIIDYGLAIKMDQQGQVSDKWCGTITTMAPEILNKCHTGERCIYSASTDMYSVAIVLIALLFGKDRTCKEVAYGDSSSFTMGWKDHKKCLFSKNGKSVEVYDMNDKYQYSFKREIWDILDQVINSRPEKRATLSKMTNIFEKHLAMLEPTSEAGCKCVVS